ncbi:MAG: hypothetical protein HOH65_10830, partial [Rhodospirillaceae bacterium]|nr:hypothetical protein [Rhodospirillaceae bacterium]
ASWVARACTSVLEQTVPVTHVLVSDGPRRTDLTGVANSVSVHLELPTPASDSGATPRVIGGRWAVENGYDIVCYLDADDALDPLYSSRVAEAITHADAEVIASPLIYADEALSPVGHPAGGLRVTWAAARNLAAAGSRPCFLYAGGLALTGRALRHVEDWLRIPIELARMHDQLVAWILFSGPYRISWLLEPSYLYRVTSVDLSERWGLTQKNGPGAEKKKRDTETATHWRDLGANGRRALAAELGIDRSRVPSHETVMQAINPVRYQDGIVLRQNDLSFAFVPFD